MKKFPPSPKRILEYKYHLFVRLPFGFAFRLQKVYYHSTFGEIDGFFMIVDWELQEMADNRRLFRGIKPRIIRTPEFHRYRPIIRRTD